jgi:hypothetical protein
MLNIFISIRNVFTSSEKKRCTGCKRRLDRAIDEQIGRDCLCDTNNCVFIKEITEAIALANHSKEPEIITWESNLNTVLQGKEVTLKWEVQYAKKVFISGIEEVPLKGEKSIVINESSVFSLHIVDFQNEEYIVENTIEIGVLNSPLINIASELIKIEEDGQVQITWQAEHVTKVTFIDNNNRINVSDTNHYSVNPTDTCNYYLEFQALDGITLIRKDILVEVYKKPLIHFFKIDRDLVLTTKAVYLEWQTEFAKKVEINFGIGEVASSGKTRLFFEENERLLIKVYGELSVIEEALDIFVFPKPLMESLLVGTPNFNYEIKMPDYKLNFKKIDVETPVIEFNEFKIPDFQSANNIYNINANPKMIELEIPEYLLNNIIKESNLVIKSLF